MPVLCVLGVRATSERLPGKVLAPIAGVPMFVHIVRRLKQSKCVADVLVTSPWDPANAEIDRACSEFGIWSTRGMQGDDTTAELARAVDKLVGRYGQMPVLRALGDQPFVDWHHIDQAAAAIETNGWDFLLPLQFGSDPVYGAGLSPWSYRTWCWTSSLSSGEERQHPGMWIRRHLDRFTYGLVDLPHWSYRPYRLEVDTEKDLELVRLVWDAWAKPHEPPLQWVVNFLDRHQDVAAVNGSVRERTGTYTSYTRAEIEQWERDYSGRPVVYSDLAAISGEIQTSHKKVKCSRCATPLVSMDLVRGRLILRCPKCGHKETFESRRPIA
jgi:spore coat polysaccharide biosynthesis protein SpsF